MKVPLIKLADSYSSLSVLYFSTYMPDATATELMATSFFGMVHLSDFLQDLHEMFARFFWMVTVSSTHNTGAGRNPKHKVSVFYTEIYANTKSDNLYPLTAGAVPITTGFTTIEDVALYIVMVKSDAGVTVTRDVTVTPPRKDWRMFHPRYATASDGACTRAGDYDTVTGKWTSMATRGLLTNWLATVDETSLAAAPSETVIKVDETVLRYSYSDAHAKT